MQRDAPQHGHPHLFGALVGKLLGTFQSNRLLELRSDFVEGTHLLGPVPLEPDDVNAERRLHQVGSAADLQPEGGCLEFGSHAAAAEPAEVTAGARRHRIVGVRGRELGKVGAGEDLVEHRLRRGSRLGDPLLVGGRAASGTERDGRVPAREQ